MWPRHRSARTRASSTLLAVLSSCCIDESLVRFSGAWRTRTTLLRKPTPTGIEIYTTHHIYNHFFAGVDQHDTRVEQLLVEDELR